MAISSGWYLELLRGRAARAAAPRVAVVGAARRTRPRGVVQRRHPGRARARAAAVAGSRAAPRPRPRTERGRDGKGHDQQQPARARPTRRPGADGTHARQLASTSCSTYLFLELERDVTISNFFLG